MEKRKSKAASLVTMCYENRFYKDCGHFSYKEMAFCNGRRIVVATGEYIACEEFYASDKVEFVEKTDPGYCDTYECWLESRIRYGWRCHKCWNKNRRNQDGFCNGRDCGHRVCKVCSPSFLLCCYDGVPVRRGGNCKECLRRSCSNCEYHLQ
ncbi:hypothetical protein PspLS_10630 [Pyricularia sp. CBS 133598]|nr:hypothetical protein PspLS_10630 [Pyricularia sp. CBS 133598]